MIDIDSYCCLVVERPVSSPSGSDDWVSRLPLRFLGLGIGVMNSARRRESPILCVGWPCSSNSQCRVGHSYGELRIGCSKKRLDIVSFGQMLPDETAYKLRLRRPPN